LYNTIGIFMKKLVLASNNSGKVREFNQLLADLGISAVPQNEFDVPSVDETGLSFVENAILKARHAAQRTSMPALADDSGLEVDALNGSPGIYSARFAGENATDSENCTLLLDKLAGVTQRSARFQCVLVYMRHATDPTPLICQGTWEGVILDAAQGDNGFGYDPVFWLPQQQCTAAQLSAEVKNRLSHRGQAARLLHSALEKYRL
jgi:XTP/dITP diphosphohydrolase